MKVGDKVRLNKTEVNVMKDNPYTLQAKLDLIGKVGPGGTYFLEKHTREWLRKELYLPSEIIDRKTMPQWKRGGSLDVVERAREHVETVLAEHQPTPMDPDIRKDLDNVVLGIMKRHKIASLPIGPS